MDKECKDCWHNYHCPMPQEGYDYDPDTCPYNPDNEKKQKQSDAVERAKRVYEKMKQFEKYVLEFDREDKDLDFVPMAFPPKQNGTYLTIRCGLGGIYTAFNTWTDDHWDGMTCDAGTTIAYSRELKDHILEQ